MLFAKIFKAKPNSNLQNLPVCPQPRTVADEVKMQKVEVKARKKRHLVSAKADTAVFVACTRMAVKRGQAELAGICASYAAHCLNRVR